MRLNLDNISVSFGENEILKNVCFEVNTKDKVAIVGRNGCGKTTLLRVITGEQEIDTDFKNNSKIQKTGKFQIGHLKQIAFENDKETFENEILKVYSEVLEIKKQINVPLITSYKPNISPLLDLEQRITSVYYLPLNKETPINEFKKKPIIK